MAEAPRKLSDVEAAYMAGFLDGEGCFRFYVDGTGHVRTIVESMTSDREYLKLLKEWFGGYLTTPAKPSPRHTQAYHWGVSKREVVLALLSQVVPHLRLKQPLATLIIKWLTGPMTKKRGQQLARSFEKVKKKVRYGEQKSKIHPHSSKARGPFG